jgi:hypothetical protein
MYVVRRHSRPLFFPTGLLALAWLLCLGCALLAGRPELRHRYRVMQVSIPPAKQAFLRLGKEAIGLYPEELYVSPARVDTMHPWHTVRFTGNPWQDDLSTRTATFVARQLHAEPDHDRGLRIYFESRSLYRSLVTILDLFQVVGLKKYWLDVQHQPTTLYTYTVPVKPCLECWSARGFSCGTGGGYWQPRPTLSFNEELKQDFQSLISPATWQPLLSPPWRRLTPLLLLLPLAAAWQLRRLAATYASRS